MTHRIKKPIATALLALSLGGSGVIATYATHLIPSTADAGIISGGGGLCNGGPHAGDPPCQLK